MELRIQVNLDGEDLSAGGEEAIERILLEAARKAARMEPGEKRKLLDINGSIVGTVGKGKKQCKYCDEDRMIEQGSIGVIEKGTIYTINSKGETVVNIKGEQANIPSNYCFHCGAKL